MTTLNFTNDFSSLIGTNEDWTKLQTNLNELRAWANGNVGAANLAAAEITNTHVSAAAAVALSKLAVLPAARVYNSANQSIPNNTLTVVAYNTERWDTDTIHDNASNNSRLTCKTAGLYVITASITWDTSSNAGFREIGIRLNGNVNLHIAKQRANQAQNGSVVNQTITTMYQLAVNDYAEVVVEQSSSVALNIQLSGSGGNYSNEFSMAYIGRTS